LTSPRPNGTGSVQSAFLCQWQKYNLCQSACATGTKSYDHPLSKTKEVLIEFRKFLDKNQSQIGQKSRVKIDFFYLFLYFTKLTPDPRDPRVYDWH